MLRNLRVPGCLVEGDVSLPPVAEGLLGCDVLVKDGMIAAIAAPGHIETERHDIDCEQGMALPCLVDMHTHLDKGHIWPRQPNPDGTHWGARTSVMTDRAANWSADDVMARMDFALRCAYAHGTAAIRTHIDSLAPQAAISWPVFAEMRERWKGRIDLQAVALFPIDLTVNDPAHFRTLVQTVVSFGGILGGMTFLGKPLDGQYAAVLRAIFEAASANGLDLDFHVDESDLPEARSLRAIADMTLATKFRGRVVAGHCCSLALAPENEITETINRVGEAGLAVVSLPMCNMYLMGRQANRTPRWRGVTLLQEFAAAGVSVAVASDNTRDPFYAYGDLDLIEVYRESVRILQLDHGSSDWPKIVARAPADIMRLPDRGRLRIGQPADLILLRARTFNELNARPQNDRVVLRKGIAIDTTPPDYRELDRLFA